MSSFLASPASRRTVASLIGQTDTTPGTSSALMLGPVAEKVSDPYEDIADVLEIIVGDAPARRPPNAWLRRNKGPAVDVEYGQVRVEGRACCARMLMALDRRVHLLRLPYDASCEECGTVYRVSQRLRLVR